MSEDEQTDMLSIEELNSAILELATDDFVRDQRTLDVLKQVNCREGGNVGLFITLVPKLLWKGFPIRWLNNFGD